MFRHVYKDLWGLLKYTEKLFCIVTIIIVDFSFYYNIFGQVCLALAIWYKL